ncbi:hypothetical protein BU25DRAFT_492743 [Macroventuria anomochaeta]|uniref:Uncharacterized protein n=1 Tax=Macroventuria anomochaeta TaxID=301207 RepID=A0ACB6RWD8_9PLEO|nr:uncharacterized protein BU25DRAFT_492743 [Macroventuria anomochaeta]KAF2625454.1 hypothetical protein BU25DRAFT_492743 [Macroventuria anomochaeta]
MHQFHLPNPTTVVSHQPADEIKPELTNVKLPPIRQVTPEQRFYYSSSVTTYESDMSRRPSVSSIASSGFHPSRSASPTFSTSTLEPQYGGARPLDCLRMQAGHVETFPYTTPILDPTAATPHTGGKASKKKRHDRKQYSKRAITGTTSSRVQKSDNEAGNRYCQALDQAEIAMVCRQGNPNIEITAAPRHGGKVGWTSLKNNNISWDVQKEDGIQPSLWNKADVNGSGILMLRQSNEQIDDDINFLGRLGEQAPSMSNKQLLEEVARFRQHLIAAKNTRGEAGWKSASQRMIYEEQ